MWFFLSEETVILVSTYLFRKYPYILQLAVSMKEEAKNGIMYILYEYSV
jgi:hypothetical protein